MAVFYAFVIEPILSGTALVKGLVYALLAWLANALIVLPWIGEGIAGSLYLSADHDLFRGSPHRFFHVARAALCALLATKKGGERLCC